MRSILPKIFVTSNCQTYGLRNSMSCLIKNGTVDGVPFNQLSDYKSLSDSDIVFAAPEYSNQLSEYVPAEKIRPIPFIYFDGFHPDITYVYSGEKTVLGPCDAYHSLIALAAYKAGFGVESCLNLFDEEVYWKLGYLSEWASAQARFESTFAEAGLDIRPAMRKWLGHGSFMHSINHPAITCIFDVAKLALQAAGVDTLDHNKCPVHDNLLQASVLPVYPEIGLLLGISGSYVFKVHAKYESIELEKFVERSFASYREYEIDSLRVGRSQRDVFTAMMEVIK